MSHGDKTPFARFLFSASSAPQQSPPSKFRRKAQKSSAAAAANANDVDDDGVDGGDKAEVQSHDVKEDNASQPRRSGEEGEEEEEKKEEDDVQVVREDQQRDIVKEGETTMKRSNKKHADSSASSRMSLSSNSISDLNGTVLLPVSEAISAGGIRRIDARSVRNLNSSQVISNISHAAKELLENAIDAGATKVNISLLQNGLESISVADNGCGIAKQDLHMLCTPNATSKLSVYDDLQRVRTYGFRGEALSALCAISTSLTVETRKENDVEEQGEDGNDTTNDYAHALGHVLTFDSNGKVVEQTRTSRTNHGTTVSVGGLFSLLPVRRREMERHLRREHGRTLQMIQCYAIICSGVRFSLYVTGESSMRTVLTTGGRSIMKDNLLGIYGVRDFNKLQEIDHAVKNVETKEPVFQLVGYISKIDTGRSSTDRQFLYVNRRPVDIPLLSRKINEVYRSYSPNRSPAYFLDVQINTTEYDVNVTPDKRTLILRNGSDIAQYLTDSLMEYFEPTRYTFLRSQASQSQYATAQDLNFNFDQSQTSSILSSHNQEGQQLESQSSQRSDNVIVQQSPSPTPMQPRSSKKRKRVMMDKSDSDTDDEVGDVDTNPTMRDKLLSYMKVHLDREEEEPVKLALAAALKQSSNVRLPVKRRLDFGSQSSETNIAQQSDPNTYQDQCPHEQSHQLQLTENRDCSSYDPCECSASVDIANSTEMAAVPTSDKLSVDGGQGEQQLFTTDEDIRQKVPKSNVEEEEDEEPITLRVVPKAIKQSFMRYKSQKRALSYENDSENSGDGSPLKHFTRFDADDELCVQEMMTQIEKEDFCRVKVIGQFNRGFIVGQLDQDLFIFDQHASDEKYNYETMQREEVIRPQRLLIPKTLDLSIADELTIMDHLPLFEHNGFTFEMNSSAPPGQRMQLRSFPSSRNVNFDEDDIHELVHLINECPPLSSSKDGDEKDVTSSVCMPLPTRAFGSTNGFYGNYYRPSKVSRMFASRACRASIMIGDALDDRAMVKVVRNLSLLQEPFHCPHGRPSMRHLFTLPLDPKRSNQK